MIKQPSGGVSPKTLAANVGDYVRGFGRNNAQGLDSLITYRQWAVMAQRELDARASRFVSVLSNEELEAIARGEVNLSEIACEILMELHGDKA